MKIRTKIMSLVMALIGGVVISIVTTLTWLEQRQIQEASSARVDALMDGVLRITKEALSARDEMMLLSYLKLLMKEYPEIEIALVNLRGHRFTLGKMKTELYYRTGKFTETESEAAQKPSTAAVTIQVGFSKLALQEYVRKAQLTLVLEVLGISGIGVLLGLFGSFWMSGLIAMPILLLTDAARKIGEGKLETSVDVQSKDEIGFLATNFNEMAARLRALNQFKDELYRRILNKDKELIGFKDELFRTLTHELNNPLVGLKSWLEMLQTPGASQGHDEKLEAYTTMSQAVKQMELSLKNAIELVKKGRPNFQVEPCSITDLISEVIKIFKQTAQFNDLKLIEPRLSAPIVISGDKEHLRRIVTNLVSNALKYTPSGGRVEVGLKDQAHEVQFSVADTGYGISPEDQERIFTAFYRVPGPDGKPQKIPGSGLGLAIVKQAVDLHHGKIWVESEKGKGSVFHVSIPKEIPFNAQQSRDSIETEMKEETEGIEQSRKKLTDMLNKFKQHLG